MKINRRSDKTRAVDISFMSKHGNHIICCADDSGYYAHTMCSKHGRMLHFAAINHAFDPREFRDYLKWMHKQEYGVSMLMQLPRDEQ